MPLITGQSVCHLVQNGFLDSFSPPAVQSFNWKISTIHPSAWSGLEMEIKRKILSFIPILPNLLSVQIYCIGIIIKFYANHSSLLGLKEWETCLWHFHGMTCAYYLLRFSVIKHVLDSEFLFLLNNIQLIISHYIWLWCFKWLISNWKGAVRRVGLKAQQVSKVKWTTSYRKKCCVFFRPRNLKVALAKRYNWFENVALLSFLPTFYFWLGHQSGLKGQEFGWIPNSNWRKKVLCGNIFYLICSI